ncbi:MAG TPA: hypothetical protein VJK53_00255 [Candidatus Paceibacterota bacterium]
MNDAQQQDDLSDIDPRLVQFVRMHAQEFEDANMRVDAIIKTGDRRVERADLNLKRNLTGGMDEKEAAKLYEAELAEIKTEIAAQFKGLEKEYETRYPAPTE